MNADNIETPNQPDRDHDWRRSLRLFATGFGMGTADVVPGVSGGTIALIAGIYSELLRSIKSVTGDTPRLLLRGQLRQAFASVPFAFLLPVLLGIGLAAFSLANLISWLLENHPSYVWAFFFGLISASILLVLKRLRRWSAIGLLPFGLAALGAYLLTGLTAQATPATPLTFFSAGAVAICAMILPGLSGSFLLIILGKYDQVLDAVANREILTLLPFFLGAAVGIAAFSRVLTWLFVRHHDLLLLLLAGLMLGTLPRIWPWKAEEDTRVDASDPELAFLQANVLPAANFEALLILALIGAGAAIILALESLRSETSSDF